MPRYKRIESGLKLIPVDFSRQVLAGSFEFALCHLIDEGEVDLSRLEARYKNDDGGAPAYDPRVLLKIVLLAYSRGIVSSRGMEAACCDDVQFMAISGNSAPHFSTLANFVSSLGPAIGKIFAQVLPDLRSPGIDWAADVRHRRGEAAVQCLQGQERQAQGLRAPGGTRWRRRSSRCWPSSARPMRGGSEAAARAPRRSAGSSG